MSVGDVCDFYARFGTISNIVIAFGAIAAAYFAWRAYMTSKSSLRHQILNDLFKEYRSPKMGIAIRKIYEFYEKDKSDFISRYVGEFEVYPHSENSIHYQRRIVSGYYQQVAALVEKDTSLKKLVYSVWKKGDLQIIPDVLIPIETQALPQCLENPPVTDEKKYPEVFKRMLRLYRNAPE